MTIEQETAMSPEEVDAFLARNESGVLSLARDDEPYAIPISYGFDAANQRFFIRLVSTPESEKRRFLASSPKTRLVVYEEDGETYRSVVAAGTLTEIAREEITVDHIEQYGTTKRPLFEIWGETRRDLNIQLYEFTPDEVSGRRIVVDRALDAQR